MIMLAAAASVDKVPVSAATIRRRLKSGKNGPPPPPPGRYYNKKSPKKNSKQNSPLDPEAECEKDSDSTGYRWCARTQTCDPPGNVSCFTADPTDLPTPDFPTTAPEPTDEPIEEPEPVEPLLGLPDTLLKQGYTVLGLALLAAGLVEDLSPPNGGLFTVMAPTNDAFSKLGKEVLGCLLQPQYVDDLQNVLLYHVANGEVLADQLVNDQEIEMLNEDNILITIGTGSRAPSSNPTTAPTASRAPPTDVPTIAPICDDDRRSQRRKIIEADNTVVINLNSEVVQPDMIASNGIGHGINRVLIPSDFNVEQFLAACLATGTPTSAPGTKPSLPPIIIYEPTDFPTVTPTTAPPTASRAPSGIPTIKTPTTPSPTIAPICDDDRKLKKNIIK